MQPDETFVPLELEGSIEFGPGATIANKREDARSKIAFAYVLGFLGILLCAMVLFGVGKMEVNSLIDLITAISAILSGPLGFIIGFYFKSQTDEDG